MDTPDRQTIAESEANKRTADNLAAAVRVTIQNIPEARDKILFYANQAVIHPALADDFKAAVDGFEIPELKALIITKLASAPKDAVFICQRNRILWIEHA